MVLIDAAVRLLPGVIGAPASLAEESFEANLLEYPHYTRPREWEGRAIPDVLLSGDHARIARWRRDQALRRTAGRRPDLVAALDPETLDRRDIALLAELGWSLQPSGRLGLTAPPVAD
jgi:tRNA (guanine37-N1)-methyltransferase